MNSSELQALGRYLAAHNLAAKSINDYSKKEITGLVDFIVESFAHNRPVPLMFDNAHRLIVPANADKGQLKAAIKMIEKLIEFDHPAAIVEANQPHVWEQYES